MSLTTRCPACGTMFNVVSDQLKVSQGWVRCGQCAVVFDAALYLQAELVPQTGLSAPDTSVDATSGLSPAASEIVNAPSAPFNPDTHQQFAAFQSSQELDSSYTEEISAALKESSAPLSAELLPGLQTPSAQVPEVSSSPVFKPGFEPADDAPEEVPEDVSFVRNARRQAFWRKPLVRVLLALLVLLLVVLLVVQWAVQQRSLLTAFEPRLKPALEAVCEVMGCTVEPVRQIEAVVIDSSSFSKVSDSVYRLSFSIKSSAPIAVAMPSLEVTLTDTQDQAVIRRVLTPAQFGMASGLLSPSGEFSGAVTLQLTPVEAGSATARRVAGYRLLAFYP